jgi:hypothetical protein
LDRRLGGPQSLSGPVRNSSDDFGEMQVEDLDFSITVWVLFNENYIMLRKKIGQVTEKETFHKQVDMSKVAKVFSLLSTSLSSPG